MDGGDGNDLIHDLNIFLQQFAVEPLTLVLLACCCWGGPILRICCRVNVPCHTSKKLCLYSFTSSYIMSDDSSGSDYYSETESSTDSDEESLTRMPMQAVRLAPPQHIGTLVSVNGELLVVQDNISWIAPSDQFQGILRYDVRANQWTEWIQYPKGMKIRVEGTVLDGKHQILYIFAHRQDGMDIGSGGWMNQIIILNLIEKTFRTESNEMLLSDDADFDALHPVMVGDVIYIYYDGDGDKYSKWNVETNQVDKVSDPFSWIRGAVYCDIQYFQSILIEFGY